MLGSGLCGTDCHVVSLVIPLIAPIRLELTRYQHEGEFIARFPVSTRVQGIISLPLPDHDRNIDHVATLS
jgi:hypothetical protein